MAVSPANKVAVFTDRQPCSSKELAELKRSASVEIDQGFLGNAQGVHFKWHEARALGLGTHYLCAYVFKRASVPHDPHTTYAHAQHKWIVHT